MSSPTARPSSRSAMTPCPCATSRPARSCWTAGCPSSSPTASWTERRSASCPSAGTSKGDSSTSPASVCATRGAPRGASRCGSDSAGNDGRSTRCASSRARATSDGATTSSCSTTASTWSRTRPRRPPAELGPRARRSSFSSRRSASACRRCRRTPGMPSWTRSRRRSRSRSFELAGRYDLEVPAGEERHVWIKTPVHVHAESAAPALRAASGDACLEAARAAWAELLAPAARVELPDAHVEDMYWAAVAAILLLRRRVGDHYLVYPGKRAYRRFWTRDAAYMCWALDIAGLPAGGRALACVLPAPPASPRGALGVCRGAAARPVRADRRASSARPGSTTARATRRGRCSSTTA